MRRAALLAAILAAVALAPVSAAPIDDALKLTGVDTPQSLALDKETAKLLEDVAKTRATLLELYRKRQPTADISRKLEELAKATYKKAEQAADARAAGAIEQRCIKPSEDAGGAARDGDTSPFVCAQVLAGGTSGGNDPWAVCACTRRYLIGAWQEIDKIRKRNASSVGKHLPDSQVPAGYPLTQAEFDFRFHAKEAIDVDYLVRQTIEPLVRKVQRTIAQDKIEGALSDRPPRMRSLAELFGGDSAPAIRADAYNWVQNAIAMLWLAYAEETRLQNDFLQQSINQLWGQERDTADAAMQRLYDADIRNDNTPYFAIAQQYDRKAGPFVLAKAQELRAIASAIKQVRWRLMRDATAWKNFAAPDGDSGYAVGYGAASFAEFIVRRFTGDWHLGVGFSAWRSNMVVVGGSDVYAANREWAYAFGQLDVNDYEGSLTRAFQKLVPEGSGTSAGTLSVAFRITTDEKETVQATASGAGDTESP